MATTTTATAPCESTGGGGYCSLCLTELSLPPKKQAPLAPTFLRQLVDLLGFDVALPLCDGCHGDVLSVIDIIRKMNKLQKELGSGVVGITKKKKVPLVATTCIIIALPPPEVKMEQEEIEEWVTPGKNATSPPLTMGHLLAPLASTSQQDQNGDHDPEDISDTESFPDDDERGDDEPDIIQPAQSTPYPATQQRPVELRLGRKFGRFNTIITTLSLKPPLFQCKACLKKFKTKNNVKYHQFCGNEGGEKPFKCEQCRKGFITRTHYEYHLRTHTGERPYPCTECDKGFNQRSKLTRHIRSVHAEEKRDKCEQPFVCNECGKSFALKDYLDAHMKSHIRPHACDICTQAFSLRKDLIRHVDTHTDKRAFKCDICATKFRRKDNFQRHIRTMHKGQEMPYLGNEDAPNSPGSESKSDPEVIMEELLPKTEVKSEAESDVSDNDDPLLLNFL